MTTTETSTGEQVITAARVMAMKWAITPKWRDRLTPDAVALVEAVLEHDRTEPAS
jgi:hypothetical protein